MVLTTERPTEPLTHLSSVTYVVLLLNTKPGSPRPKLRTESVKTRHTGTCSLKERDSILLYLRLLTQKDPDRDFEVGGSESKRQIPRTSGKFRVIFRGEETLRYRGRVWTSKSKEKETPER